MVDGNDVAAVRQVVGDAVGVARAGQGPSLIEAQTYRLKGHSAADGATYRPADEVARWRERDPLLLARAAGSGRRAPRPRSWPRSTLRSPQTWPNWPGRCWPGRPQTRRGHGPTCGATGAGNGGTDLPAGRRGRAGPGDGPGRPGRAARRGRGLRRRVQDHHRAGRAVRRGPGAGYADLRAGHRRCGHGRGHGRAAAGRRDHVRRLLRDLLGPGRQRDRQGPLHDRRAGQRAAGAARREWLGRAGLRQPARPVGGELGDDRARAEDRRTGRPGRGVRPAGRGHPGRRPGAGVRAQGPVRAEGRGGGRASR